MAIDSKNLLVWVKAMSRGQALPLDASEIYATLAEAENYASSSAIAYAGQTVKAMLADGKYHTYTLQPSEAGYVLEEIGAIDESDLTQYVQVVETLPTSGQIQGVLYINNTDGYIWTGSAWKKVFWDVTTDVTGVSNRVTNLETEMPNKAPLANPVFSGTVKVGEDEVALKSYVEGLFANLVSSAPGIVDSTNALPTTGYKAGQTFRVAEAGTYAGVDCEAGDLIIVVQNYAADTASNNDFMVVQANIDGAVTSSADTTTIGEIVVFDAVTGKVIKGSGVQIASLNDAIAKAHEHSNKTVLDSYDKTQTELLATAKSEAQALVTARETAVNTALGNKADKATTLAGYGITDAYNKTETDGLLKTITDNLNTKITGAEVDNKITEATPGILEQAAEATANAIANKADKATTLAGYGITDAHTKNEITNLLSNKADKATTLAGYGITDAYTKTDTDGKLETKAAKTLYINLIEGDNGEYGVDKTGKEIIDAYNAGGVLYIGDDGVYIPMRQVFVENDSTEEFMSVMFQFDEYCENSNNTLEYRVITMNCQYGTVEGYDVNAAVVTGKHSYDPVEDTLNARVGSIPENTTIKSYVDTAVGSGGTASAQAIATAKQEAITTSKDYTDTQISDALAIVEF